MHTLDGEHQGEKVVMTIQQDFVKAETEIMKKLSSVFPGQEFVFEFDANEDEEGSVGLKIGFKKDDGTIDLENMCAISLNYDIDEDGGKIPGSYEVAVIEGASFGAFDKDVLEKLWYTHLSKGSITLSALPIMIADRIRSLINA